MKMFARPHLLLLLPLMIYCISFGWLVDQGRPVEDALAVLLIFGLAMSALAAGLTRRLPLPAGPRAWVSRESGVLAALTLAVTLMLAFKGPVLDVLAGEGARARAVADLGLKLTFFVALPLLAYRLAIGIAPADLGLRLPRRAAPRLWIAGGVMAAAGVAVQLLLGHGADPLWRGEFSRWQLVVGVLCELPWLLLEVGLVEEFFFRALLQGRITAATGSAAAGIAVSALVFGLAHAPGLWLRGAGLADALGPAPGPALAVAYSIATMSLAGVFLGVLWARSRSLWLVMTVHVMIDALPNAPEFIRLWLPHGLS